MQGSTCDAMQGCVGSTEDEASGRAIRHDMRGRSRWSPALVACCLLSVDRRHVHGRLRDTPSPGRRRRSPPSLARHRCGRDNVERGWGWERGRTGMWMQESDYDDSGESVLVGG